MTEFELRRRLRALRVDHQPAQDLWAGIAGQLSGVEPWRPARASRRMLWPWAAAASVALAVATGLWFSQVVVLPPADGVVDASAGATERNPPAERYSPWLEREADAMTLGYEAAIASARAGEATPAEPRRPDFVAASRELDSAAAELRQALAQDPESIYLLELLRRTEGRRLDLARLSSRIS